MRGRKYEWLENFGEVRFAEVATTVTDPATTSVLEKDASTPEESPSAKGGDDPPSATPAQHQRQHLGTAFPFLLYSLALASFHKIEDNANLKTEVLSVSEICDFRRVRGCVYGAVKSSNSGKDGKRGGKTQPSGTPSGSSGDQDELSASGSRRGAVEDGGEDALSREDLEIKSKTYFAVSRLCQAVVLFPHQLELLLKKNEV